MNDGTSAIERPLWTVSVRRLNDGGGGTGVTAHYSKLGRMLGGRLVSSVL